MLEASAQPSREPHPKAHWPRVADLVLGRRSQPARILLGDGTGGFVNTGIALGATNADGVYVVDYDGDGDLDIHITRVLNPDSLYRQDSGFVFTDVSVAVRELLHRDKPAPAVLQPSP